MYRLSADQMGGSTTSTVDVTTYSTVMLSFLDWVIPQYIVLAPTTRNVLYEMFPDKTICTECRRLELHALPDDCS